MSVDVDLLRDLQVTLLPFIELWDAGLWRRDDRDEVTVAGVLGPRLLVGHFHDLATAFAEVTRELKRQRVEEDEG